MTNVDSVLTVEEPDDVGSSGQRRFAGPLLLGAVALVVAAAVVAVWFGVAWIRAGNDPALSQITARDEVDRVARQAIVTFHTIDYRKADETLSNWEAASTGQLHKEVVDKRDRSRQAIEAAKTVATPKVLALAVTDLNDFDGTAGVIAATEVSVSVEGQQPATKYHRIQGTLQRVGDSGWKLSGILIVDFPRN